MSSGPAPAGATAGIVTGRLGLPRLHVRAIDSTNARARALAGAGAPHGTLITAGVQTAGRGRQGRTWSAPPGRALLCSLIARYQPPLLSLRAGIAVAELAGERSQLKWPNDVLVEGLKVAGILVEGRPQDGWAVIGIGINVALREADLQDRELAGRAGTLGLAPAAIEPTLAALLVGLERWLAAPAAAVLDAVRARDALLERPVTWADGEGTGAGIDADGRLLVRSKSGRLEALSAGEVHLLPDLRSQA